MPVRFAAARTGPSLGRPEGSCGLIAIVPASSQAVRPRASQVGSRPRSRRPLPQVVGFRAIKRTSARLPISGTQGSRHAVTGARAAASSRRVGAAAEAAERIGARVGQVRTGPCRTGEAAKMGRTALASVRPTEARRPSRLNRKDAATVAATAEQAAHAPRSTVAVSTTSGAASPRTCASFVGVPGPAETGPRASGKSGQVATARHHRAAASSEDAVVTL